MKKQTTNLLQGLAFATLLFTTACSKSNQIPGIENEAQNDTSEASSDTQTLTSANGDTLVYVN